MELALEIIDRILTDLDCELARLKPQVFNHKVGDGDEDNFNDRCWENYLQKYDECLLKKYQTLFIKNELTKNLGVAVYEEKLEMDS